MASTNQPKGSPSFLGLDGECAAIVFAFLYNNTFKIYTDHKILKYIFTQNKLNMQ